MSETELEPGIYRGRSAGCFGLWRVRSDGGLLFSVPVDGEKWHPAAPLIPAERALLVPVALDGESFSALDRVPSGPAQIVIAPPIPETDRRYFEVYCPVCTTHEGVARHEDAEMLIQKRDEHNALHLATPLPGPATFAQLEHAAIVLYEWDTEDNPSAPAWGDLTGDQRDIWRSGARVALDAASRVRS